MNLWVFLMLLQKLWVFSWFYCFDFCGNFGAPVETSHQSFFVRSFFDQIFKENFWFFKNCPYNLHEKLEKVSSTEKRLPCLNVETPKISIRENSSLSLWLPLKNKSSMKKKNIQIEMRIHFAIIIDADVILFYFLKLSLYLHCHQLKYLKLSICALLGRIAKAFRIH